MKKIIFVFIILIILGSFAFYYYQRNIFSLDDVPLEIIGPREVTVFDQTEYVVQYKNNSDVRLEDARLVFEYPLHTISRGTPAFREEVELDDILPGQERIVRFPAQLLGKEGDLKLAKAFLSYRPQDLRARFESQTTFSSTITSVPIQLGIDIPSRIPIDTDFSFRINYASNLAHPLLDVGIQAEYPSGFEVLESRPMGLESTVWEVPLLNQEEGGVIDVTGTLTGQLGQGKVFLVQLGVWVDGEFVVLKEVSRGAQTDTVSLLIQQRVNGSAQYAPLPGEVLHYEIIFQNVGQDTLHNLFMVAQLEGEFFDFESVQANAGRYQEGTRSVTFNWSDVPKLERLLPQEEGKVEFWISLKDDIERTSNPSIFTRILVDDEREEFSLRVGTNLAMTQRGFYFDEVFGNSGPIPPQVGTRTTYTVIWEVKNFHSDTRNVHMSAELPSYVTFPGNIFPNSEVQNLHFDSSSRELTWDVGEVEAGTGVDQDPRSVAFQLSFIPLESHQGTSPVLIHEAQGTGQDIWAERLIEFSAPALTTTLPDDSEVTEEEGIVQ